MKCCAVILARGGSKSIPRKNLVEYLGSPLVTHPIRAAQKSLIIPKDEVWVSTDDDEIASHARHEGAKVISRPPELAGDLSTDYEAMRHFLMCHQAEEQYDFIVHLRATYPTIDSQTIDKAIRQFRESWDGYDSLRSVVRAEQSPYKMWKIGHEFRLEQIIPDHVLHSAPRQLAPPVYWQNAAVDIIKTWTIMNMQSVTGDRIMPFFMKDDGGVDIDTPKDLKILKERAV